MRNNSSGNSSSRTETERKVRPINRQPNNDNRNSTPSRDKFSVSLYYKKNLIKTLLDSGAEIDVISESWASKYPELKKEKSSHTLVAAFGKRVRNPLIVNIPISNRNGTTITVRCAIAPLDGHPDLLLSDQTRRKLKIPWPEDSNPQVEEGTKQEDTPATPARVCLPPDTQEESEAMETQDTALTQKQPMPMKIEQEIIKHPRVFAQKLSRAGTAKINPIEIHVPKGKQVYVPPRTINQTLISDLRKEIETMQESAVIEPSTSRHNTPLMVLRKPNGKLRVCADLRALNRVCEEFEWEFPRLDVALSRMTAASIFSKIDLTSGFWQLPLHPESRDYTTFRFDGKTWRFTVVPFGWKGAPASFQSTMDMILQHGINKGFLSVYMDDILVHSRNIDEHVRHLKWTLNQLEKFGFFLNQDKCVFGVDEVEFLGHIISANGVRPKKDKLDLIQNLKVPRNLHELRSLLGTLGFYQTFIQGFASITRPISALLSKQNKFHWGLEQETALQKVKAAFADLSPLAYIDPENTREFILITDASINAIGAQLIKINNQDERSTVLNVSRTLSGPESRYTNTERELLAITWALSRLEIITAGKPIIVHTDHAALIPILTGSVKTFQQQELRDYDRN
jgi:hypothetical protein